MIKRLLFIAMIVIMPVSCQKKAGLESYLNGTWANGRFTLVIDLNAKTYTTVLSKDMRVVQRITDVSVKSTVVTLQLDKRRVRVQIFSPMDISITPDDGFVTNWKRVVPGN